MIKHYPIVVHSVSDLLSEIFVWALVELFVWIIILLISERPFPRLNDGFRRAARIFNEVARRRRLVVALLFLVVFVGRIALYPLAPTPPPPGIMDEHSQLLSADTFAHWRVTNPTHPMWFYFQTFMVNQQPTYHSIYPPATGFFMAVSQVLTGEPWYGALFAVALAAAAIGWMLQGWVTPRWALWGGLLFVLLAVRIRLTENYLGEGNLVLGGALALGAIPRLVKKSRFSAGVLLGFGVALLATTRPYEGMFFIAATGLGAIYWAIKTRMKASAIVKNAVVPVVAVLLPVLVAVAYLNWRSTGNAMVAPYQVNLIEQHITRPMIWQKPASPGPNYDHAAMAAFYKRWELDWWQRTHQFPKGPALFLLDKADVGYSATLWPLLTLLLVGSVALLKDPMLRFLPIALGIFFVGLGLETYQLLPRYVEASWGLVILLSVFGLRHIGIWRRRNHFGLRVSRAAAILIPGLLALCIFSFYLAGLYYTGGRRSQPWPAARQHILRALESLPGKQLVIVRYSPSHFAEEEWVYNAADIDRAKVVWARDVPSGGEQHLLRYFHDHTVWLLEPDGEHPKLSSYCTQNGCGSSMLTSSMEPGLPTSEVGSFQVSCTGAACEDLKRGLALSR